MKDAYILILMDCNNDCLFCSVPKKKTYLSISEIKTKIDKYKKENYDQITITGGEPTLHPGLPNIIKYIKSLNMECRITTNGTKLTKNLIKDLELSGLTYIAISIHSFHQITASKISNNPDYNLNNIFKAINYILTRDKIRLYINITISKLNYKELPFMAKIISDKLSNVHMINFNYIDIWGNVLKKNLKSEIGLRYYIADKYLHEAFTILKNSDINFRAERIPLCYLIGFEENSSDYNRAIQTEEATTDFIEGGIQELDNKDYIKGESCVYCTYTKLCPGVSLNYHKAFGTADLYPIFEIKK